MFPWQFYILFVRMRHEVQLLLSLYLSSEVFLIWQVELVFGSKHLVVLGKSGVSGYIRVSFGTEDDSYSWVVVWSFLHLVIHLQVHVHLTDILIGDAVDL